MKKIYGYDVYYRLKTSSCLLVTAHNRKEAKEEALRLLEDMPREELVSRFLAALDFEPSFKIEYVDKVDEMDEEDFGEVK